MRPGELLATPRPFLHPCPIRESPPHAQNPSPSSQARPPERPSYPTPPSNPILPAAPAGCEKSGLVFVALERGTGSGGALVLTARQLIEVVHVQDACAILCSTAMPAP
jgi:hypothetical protein